MAQSRKTMLLISWRPSTPLCIDENSPVLCQRVTERLLASIDDDRDYAISMVLLDTGIRVGVLESVTRE